MVEKETQKSNKSVLEDMQDFIKRKEELAQELKQYRKTKPKQTSNSEPTKISKPVSIARPEPKSYLQEFEEKLVKDFGLTVKTDSYGWHQLFFKTFKVFELIPRKGFWFGVYREDPEQDNKWRCFRVNSKEDQAIHYAFCKEFVELNSQ